MAAILMSKTLRVLVASALLALGACSSPPDRDTTPTHSPSPEAAELPSGSPPAIAYVRGRRYLTPNGAPVPLPGGGHGVSGVVPLGDALLVSDTRWFEGTNGLALVRDGERRGVWGERGTCSSGTPVASAGGECAAWVALECPESADATRGTVHRARSDGSGEVAQELGPGVTAVVGFLGDDLVLNREFPRGAWRTDLQSTPTRIPGVDRVQDVSATRQLMIGHTHDEASVVIDQHGGVLWSLDDGYLKSFSPSGSLVLAHRGPEGQEISVHDSQDGEVLARVTLPSTVDASSMVWESDTALLAQHLEDQLAGIVRIGFTGKIERATPAVTLKSGSSRFVLLPPQPR